MYLLLQILQVFYPEIFQPRSSCFWIYCIPCCTCFLTFCLLWFFLSHTQTLSDASAHNEQFPLLPHYLQLYLKKKYALIKKDFSFFCLHIFEVVCFRFVLRGKRWMYYKNWFIPFKHADTIWSKLHLKTLWQKEISIPISPIMFSTIQKKIIFKFLQSCFQRCLLQICMKERVWSLLNKEIYNMRNII